MSQNEMSELKKMIQDSIKASDTRHTEVMEKMAALSARIEPVCDIYDNLNGFGGVLSWLFKYIIMPVSVIIGIIVAWTKLK